MPGRRCTPEAGAPTEPASALVDGHGHFRLGVDQPDYARLLRCFASFDRAALHASVTRRAASYGFRLQWVSIQPSGTKAAEADPRPFQRAFGSGTVPGIRIGGFITNAIGDGASVSLEEVQTLVLNWCFGVSMLGR